VLVRDTKEFAVLILQCFELSSSKKLRKKLHNNIFLTIPFSVPTAKYFELEIVELEVTAPLSFILLAL
jgi:hypothetical protein